MPTITFRGKVEPVYHPDNTLAYELIKVPRLERRHCDMNGFRRHPKYGGLANSDLFPSLLARIAADTGLKSHLRLDQLPAGVSVDRSSFLATITVQVA